MSPILASKLASVCPSPTNLLDRWSKRPATPHALSQVPSDVQLLTRNPRLRHKAEEHLIEANRLDPSLAEGYLALGDLYLKSSRKEDAMKLYREVLRWEPGHLEATARLQQLGKR